LPGKIVRVPINSVAFLERAIAGAVGMLQSEVRITHRAGDHSLGSTHFIIFRGAPSWFNRQECGHLEFDQSVWNRENIGRKDGFQRSPEFCFEAVREDAAKVSASLTDRSTQIEYKARKGLHKWR
jgi:hypothetical protein